MPQAPVEFCANLSAQNMQGPPQTTSLSLTCNLHMEIRAKAPSQEAQLASQGYLFAWLLLRSGLQAGSWISCLWPCPAFSAKAGTGASCSSCASRASSGSAQTALAGGANPCPSGYVSRQRGPAEKCGCPLVSLFVTTNKKW